MILGVQGKFLMMQEVSDEIFRHKGLFTLYASLVSEMSPSRDIRRRKSLSIRIRHKVEFPFEYSFLETFRYCHEALCFVSCASDLGLQVMVLDPLIRTSTPPLPPLLFSHKGA
jgi:hypothetical protein